MASCGWNMVWQLQSGAASQQCGAERLLHNDGCMVQMEEEAEREAGRIAGALRGIWRFLEGYRAVSDSPGRCIKLYIVSSL